MKKQIKFYGRTKPNPKYWPFSNFYPAPFVDSAGTIWPTTEHYFQAMKFLPESMIEVQTSCGIRPIPIRTYIWRQPNPKLAAKEGRRRDLPLRKDWDQYPQGIDRYTYSGKFMKVKDHYMLKALWYKFTQHKDLRDLLCETGNAEIIEHTRNDSYWGDGGDGTGQNMLGKLLMIIREELTCKTPDFDCEDCQDCCNEGESINRYKRK